jgi:transcriptional regulator with XRE-family HTH domain
MATSAVKSKRKATSAALMPIASLVLARAVYPRRDWEFNRVDSLVDVLEAGTQLPPITVQRGTGVVLNGWHRVKAYEALARTDIPVEEVDVADEDLLSFACRQDDAAALPYTQEDRKDVAGRLYYAGHDIAAVARVMHRSRQTVERWLHEDIARGAAGRRHEKAVRAVVVHALTGIGWSQRQIASRLGISQMQVRRDAQMSITSHLADEDQDDLVDDARAALARIGQDDQTVRQASLDWLHGQLDAATGPVPASAPPDQGDVDEDDLDDTEEDVPDRDVDDPRAPGDAGSVWATIRPIVADVQRCCSRIAFSMHTTDVAGAAHGIVQEVATIRGLLDDLVTHVESLTSVPDAPASSAAAPV